MGILKNFGTHVEKSVKSAMNKAANGVVSLSELSSSQLEEVERKRAEYLGSIVFDGEEKVIERNLGAIGIELFRAYLPQIQELYLPVTNEYAGKQCRQNRIRFFDITKWVTNAEENNFDKLINVYQVLDREECSIGLIYQRKRDGCRVTLAVSNNSKSSEPPIVNKLAERLQNALLGNFPGAEIKYDKEKQNGILEGMEYHQTCSVASISNLAAEKSEGFISQSIEKLLDGIVPDKIEEEYSIVLLANPIIDQSESRSRLNELFTALSPFAVKQLSDAYTESAMIMSMANAGINLSANAGYSAGGSQNFGKSVTESVSKGKSDTVGANGGAGPVGGHYEHGRQSTRGTATGTSETSGVYANSQGGFNFGAQFSRSSGVTMQIGKSTGITRSYTNYTVKHSLEMLERQMKRLEQCVSLGMWDFAAYVISPSPVIANNVAHMYLALTQGENSYLEQSAVNLWYGDRQKDTVETILSSLKVLQHPVFGLRPDLEGEWLEYPAAITPSAFLSGRELAYALNFPGRSVSGLPVLQCVPFGREVIHYSDKEKEADTLNIGSIFHMHKRERKYVELDVDSLSAHVFITGSTGAGKSNMVYHILKELQNKEVKFLVVEPAKGEYKNVFGGKEGVCVYGTNMKKTPLLRLNPFSFPEDIHVLEHMDRLVEIFNACWPMYAAMPAVLKDAIEQAYRRKGWDMISSECHPRIFPTFADLMEELPRIISSSAYSEDTKGDYVGSLVTRIKSLTNGINGQIFCSFAELTGEELFDRNVIVDISRVGSMETKSLIMGILVMKLQEYRMASEGANRELQHVTVLEEAHHLLRRTSSAQSQESSNLQGKSVEMIANAIAEMRTYGEGFIIADQAPGLMDESVIRNTNTKIILRLPDEADRILVGKSVALKEKQVEELAKLPVGVAAVYQNDWLEAVLCEVDEFEEKEKYKYERIIETEDFSACFFCLYGKSDLSNLSCVEIEKMRDWISQLSVSERTKSLLKKCINGNSLRQEEKEMVTYNLFRGKYLAQLLENAEDEKAGIKSVREEICFMYGIKSPELVAEICNVLLQSIFSEGKTPQLQKRYMEYMGRKTVS